MTLFENLSTLDKSILRKVHLHHHWSEEVPFPSVSCSHQQYQPREPQMPSSWPSSKSLASTSPWCVASYCAQTFAKVDAWAHLRLLSSAPVSLGPLGWSSCLVPFWCALGLPSQSWRVDCPDPRYTHLRSACQFCHLNFSVCARTSSASHGPCTCDWWRLEIYRQAGCYLATFVSSW